MPLRDLRRIEPDELSKRTARPEWLWSEKTYWQLGADTTVSQRCRRRVERPRNSKALHRESGWRVSLL